MEQGKLVYVVSGKVYDVVVDIRKGSPWFGRSVGVTLQQGYAFWVPLGFIHGFQALEDAYFLYLVTKEYLQQHERCISWSGPEVGIDRPIKESMVIGEKDRKSHRSGKLRRTSNIANKTTMETNLLMAFCISNKACHPLR
jgi:dTDP-4-dehydrorhamnose 3,5-epimerase